MCVVCMCVYVRVFVCAPVCDYVCVLVCLRGSVHIHFVEVCAHMCNLRVLPRHHVIDSVCHSDPPMT